MSSRIRPIYLRNGEYSKYLSEFTEAAHIASGAFGSVDICTNKFDKKDYAVKKILVGRSGMSVERVLREAEILGAMNHQNVVRYYHTWVESKLSGRNELQMVSKSESMECVYILMECYDRSLKDFIEEKKKFQKFVAEKGRVLQLFKECVSAVFYIHSKKYLHGDLSTANIFLESDMTARVGDFGLARRLDEDGCVVLSNSFGHEIYRAPECGYKTWGQNKESESEPVKVGTKADIFSLGVILTRMVYSKQGLTVFKRLRETGMPAMWKKGLYDPILAKLLSLNPDDRPSAAELLLEIENLQSSGGASASSH